MSLHLLGIQALTAGSRVGAREAEILGSGTPAMTILRVAARRLSGRVPRVAHENLSRNSEARSFDCAQDGHNGQKCVLHLTTKWKYQAK